MKSRIVTATLAFAAFSGIGSAQAAASDAWYGGLRLGRGVERLGSGEIDGALGTQGALSASSIDSGATSYGLFAGYQLNPNFAVEGGYDHLGSFGFSSAVSAPAADSASGHYEARSLDLSAVGLLPFAHDWAAFGKAGLAYSEAKLDASSGGAVSIGSAHHWDMAPLVGAGISYDLTRQTALRAEWDRFLHVGDASTGRGDIDQYTVGVAYRF
jgi:hypothetical protein